MNYSRKLIFAVLFAATSVFAAEHDNNIIYKDGDPLKIQSKIGVEVQLTGDIDFAVMDGNRDKVFVVDKKDNGLARMKLDGNNASNLVVDIVESYLKPIEDRVDVVEGDVVDIKETIGGLQSDMAIVKGDIVNVKNDVAAVKLDLSGLSNRVTAAEADIRDARTRLTEVEEAIADLLGLRRFAIDYAIFKSITTSRLKYLYNDIAHTYVNNDGLDTNKMDKCAGFPTIRSMGLTDTYGGLFSSPSGNIPLYYVPAGADPSVWANWTKVMENGPVDASRYNKKGADGQGIFGGKYARDIIYNKIENRFYQVLQAGGIKYCEAAGISVARNWKQTTFDSGIITSLPGQIITDVDVNCYHAAIGADGVMVATTEFGPVWKERGGTVWHKINLPEHDSSKPIRCVAAGNAFLKKAEVIARMGNDEELIEVRQTRDLAMAKSADERVVSDYLLPAASRFVLGSTLDEGIWYSNPFDIENGWKHVDTLADGSSFATGFRQIVFHNGTYVAPVYIDTPSLYTKPLVKGIFYSYDGSHWKLSPGTETISKTYEPVYAAGTFVVPKPWSNGQIAGSYASANPEQGFKEIGGGYGYGAEESEFGTFVYGSGGLYNTKNSARLISPVIYSKTEVDAMINELKNKVDALLPAGALQPLE